MAKKSALPPPRKTSAAFNRAALPRAPSGKCFFSSAPPAATDANSRSNVQTFRSMTFTLQCGSSRSMYPLSIETPSGGEVGIVRGGNARTSVFRFSKVCPPFPFSN